MKLYIVRGPYGQLFGIYSTPEKAQERKNRTGKSYIIETELDRDSLIRDIKWEDDGK